MKKSFVCLLLVFQTLATITSAGFLYGEPCSERNTVHLNNQRIAWPEQVNCVDISRIGTQDIERKLTALTSVHTLYASGMKLKQIPYAIVTALPHLELMDFARNKLTRMAPNVFHRNARLQKLILADNYVKVFAKKPLLRHNGITDLVLTRNRLKSLPYYTFARLPALKVLFLDNNQLQYLPDRLFANLKRLAYLNVKNNPLQVVPQLDALPKTLLFYKYDEPVKNDTLRSYMYYKYD